VAGFNRNQWPVCVGTGGRIGSEYAYAASADYSLGFDSNILGIESITDARPISKRYSIVGTVISFFFGILIPFDIQLSIKIFKMNNSRKRYLIISLINLVAGLAMVVLYTIFLRGDSPPF